MNRGTVLISVLWVITILSLISLSLASAVRAEMASSLNTFDSERAFYMAKGAAEVVYDAISKKQDIPEDSPVRLENGVYVFPFESGEARVRLESAAGLIDLNAASDKLLASMFDSIGLEEERRNRIVDSILDWRDSDDIPHLYGAEVNDYPENRSGPVSRPRNNMFQSVAELLLVRNMTPEIFYGDLVRDALTGQYRRIPGVREMITVQSGRGLVNPNEASADVLSALPAMRPGVPPRIISERTSKKFTDETDLVRRVPEMFGADTLQYLAFDDRLPTALVSTATISSSGASKTLRLLFRRRERILYFNLNPVIFTRIQEIRLDRWQF